MSRYIDAEKINLPEGFFNKVDNVPKFYEWVEAIPTADVVEVRRGKWQMKPLFNSHLDESDVAVMIRCSGCGMKLIAQKCGPFPNYCANCGSKNDAEGGNDVQK